MAAVSTALAIGTDAGAVCAGVVTSVTAVLLRMFFAEQSDFVDDL